jgi:ubiquinone/menaquinone biosynthesis C-methylase UbiE
MAECAVELTRSAIVQAFETARAFDAVAGEYDRTNRANPILTHMRERALNVLRAHVEPGSALLDIGCGPGTDHPAMLAAGFRVTGIDVSPGMVREARRRAAALGAGEQPAILHRSIDELSHFAPRSFDAAFSNFGPLNCVADLAQAAWQIHEVLRPGGVFVASVIGRICPWEIALYLSRGQIDRAFLRFRTGMVSVPLKDRSVWMQYVTPAQFRRAFESTGFVECGLQGIGVVAPPPYLERFASRHPMLTSTLLAADDAIGRLPLFRATGDHFLMVLRRN